MLLGDESLHYVQSNTNKQFIVNYRMHQSTPFSNTLQSHINNKIKSLGINPFRITAEADYDCEGNY